MPKVPIYNVPQQETRAAPAAFQSARGATPEAFGGGIGRALEQGAHDMGRAADLMYKRQLEIKQENDVATVKAADVQFNDEARRLLFDPESGYFAKRGKAAVDAYPEVEQALSQLRDKHMSALANVDQRRLFDGVSGKRRSSALDDMARHAARERTAWLDSTAEARAADAIDDAINRHNDPQAVALSLTTGRNEILDIADRHGWSAEQKAKALRDYDSRLLRSVVERKAAEDPVGAQAFYDKVKSRIDGADHTAIEKMLKPAVDKEMSRRHTERILSGAATEITDKIVQQAQAQGVDPHVALTVVQIESGFDPTAKNPDTTAYGLSQITDKTWAGLGGTAADRDNIDRQIELGVKNIAENTKAAEKALGRKLEGWEQYVIHQQGLPSGVKLLRAGRDEKATAVIGGEKQVTLNGGEKDDTVGAFLDKWKAKFERTAAAVKLPAAGDSTRDRAIAADRALAQQLEAARAIPDPDQRDMTISRLKQRNAEARAAAEAAERAELTQAYEYIDRGARSIDEIPNFHKVSGRDREGLQRFLDRLNDGDDRTDLLTYDMLMREAGENPEAFAKRELRRVLHLLSRSDAKRVMDLQRQVLAAGAKAAEKTTSVRTTNQVIDDTIRTMGLDPSPKPDSASTSDAHRVALFRRRAQEEIDALEANEQRKAKPAEIQEIVDRLAIKGFMSGTGWLWTDIDNEKRFMFEVKPGDRERFYIEYDDIPSDRRAGIEKALSAVNKSPTRKLVSEIYEAGIFNDRSVLERNLLVNGIEQIPERDQRDIEAALRRAGKPVTDAAVIDLFNRWLMSQARGG